MHSAFTRNFFMKAHKLFLFIFSLFLYLNLSAENTKDFALADSIALSMPDSLTCSVETMATFIRQQLTNETDRVRCIYTWIVSHINYDLALAAEKHFYTDEELEHLPPITLQTRTGVCLHYTHLFAALANQVGLSSYVVTGYIKDGERVVTDIGHSWICTKIDSTWTLHDPTWGAGFSTDNRFYRRPTSKYFCANPKEFIWTHMPYDPMWQLLYHPVGHAEFVGQEADAPSPFFNYPDTLAAFETQNDIERLYASTRRMEQSGIANELMQNEIANNLQRINNYHYGEAVKHYNIAIESLNTFIAYYNNHFIPKMEEAQITTWIDTATFRLQAAQGHLHKIKRPIAEMSEQKQTLDQEIHNSSLEIKTQKEFVSKYFSTPRLFRKSLFYKYTWMGIPLN